MTSVGLLGELKADRPALGVCSVCVFLSGRPESEQAEWKEAFSDKAISSAALYRAMKRRGYNLTDSPVKTHRANHL